MTTKLSLIAARTLIADREHWTFGNHAQTRDGDPVYPDEPNAYCFCADGALAKVCGVKVDSETGDWQSTPAYETCAAAMRSAAQRLFPDVYSHVAVNDGECGTIPDDVSEAKAYDLMHENILRVFDDAILRAA